MLGSKNIFAKESAAGSDPSSAAMTMKMKGLLKGLRYISQIFDEEEEPELQIGNPTDVKHVAHIGWDGPTANAPSWINQFKGEGDAGGAGAAADDVDNGSKANDKRGGSDSTADTSSKRKSDKPRASRRKGSTESSSVEPQHDSPSNDPASGTKEKSSRRKKSKASSGTSSKTSKSKQTSQPVDGIPAPSGPKGSKSKDI